LEATKRKLETIKRNLEGNIREKKGHARKIMQEKLMERLAAGFFIRIHSFCIMGNHFHILATGMELEAQMATTEELLRRYKLIYGKEAEPPQGSYESSGNIIPDADGAHFLYVPFPF